MPPSLAGQNGNSGYKAFQQNKVPTDRIVFKGAVHGFKGADHKRAAEALVEWFSKYLTPAGDGATK